MKDTIELLHVSGFFTNYDNPDEALKDLPNF